LAQYREPYIEQSVEGDVLCGKAVAAMCVFPHHLLRRRGVRWSSEPESVQCDRSFSSAEYVVVVVVVVVV
jgi:hypothetical protein